MNSTTTPESSDLVTSGCRPSSVKPHYRVCNFCEAMCGVEVTYDPAAPEVEKKIVVKPDANDPFSKGSMCPKAPALGPLHYDPSRLRYPTKRVGGEWIEISWEEAYSTIEEQIKSIRSRFGPNAIASYLGNPIVHNLGMLLYVKTLTRALGSRNVFSATSMDQLPHHFAAHFMYGHEFRIPVPDIDRTDHMIIMGANPIASNGSMMTSAGITERLRKITKRGGKFVVIDPRKTETGKIASEHHFIKPGTDVYFLLAFLHTIFRDNRVKLGHVAEYIKDFDQLKPLVREFSPEAVAPVTGISAQIIKRLVKEYTSHKRAVLYGRMGLSTQPHGGLCHWLISCINITSGHFDTPGGMMFPSPAIELVRASAQQDLVGRWKSRVRGLKEFYGELPVSSMTEELVTEGDGQVHAFVTICGNPVLSTPSGKRLDEALPNVEFMLSIDNYINETTRHADIILPTPSGLEVDHYDLIFNIISVSNNVKFSEALFPPDGSRPYDWQILKELSRRLSPSGLSLLDRISTPRRIVNWGLMLGPYGKLSHPKRWFSGLTLQKVINSTHGINLGPLCPRVPECLITPDKKIHIAAGVFVNRLMEIKHKEFPTLVREARNPVQDNCFVLVGRRNVSTNNSWMHQFKKLSRSKQVRCTIMINPDDAGKLSVLDGDEVKVISHVGEIVVPAELTDTMMPGVVSIPHGFGHTRSGTRVPHAEAKPGVSINDITDHMRIDVLTGNAAFSGQPIRIERVSTGTGRILDSGKPITIIYGSQTGNAAMVARDTAKYAPSQGLLAAVMDMDDVSLDELSQAERVLVICSTFGEGEMPDSAEGLWEQVIDPSAPRLENSYYSVLALGDSSYETFCNAGKQWDLRLSELGATRIGDRVDCDVDYSDAADDWIQSVLPVMSKKGDQTILVTAEERVGKPGKKYFNRQNPLIAELVVKRLLSQSGSTKETMHYELMPIGSCADYEVGDAINIIPINRDDLVDELLSTLGSNGNERVHGRSQTYRERLTNDLEIRTPPKALIAVIAENTTDESVKALLAGDDPQATDEYLWGKDIVDLLRGHPDTIHDVATLHNLLRPLTPRSYSISSSPNVHPNAVHLTVATVRYTANGRQHNGVGSTCLADVLQLGDKVKYYFTPNKAFSLPDDGDSPIIMIGPGTGVAPFRAFLQEREFRSHNGEAWLFFGDRNAATDFLYEQEFKSMQQRGVLSKLDLAFSRDHDKKVYVQDRMRENSAELFSWLERGAYVYVCGDSKNMAKDVDKVLHEIIEQHGAMTCHQGKEYVDLMKRNKRYVRDVY